MEDGSGKTKVDGGMPLTPDIAENELTGPATTAAALKQIW